jgi:hypothetical protein
MASGRGLYDLNAARPLRIKVPSLMGIIGANPHLPKGKLFVFVPILLCINYYGPGIRQVHGVAYIRQAIPKEDAA